MMKLLFKSNHYKFTQKMNSHQQTNLQHLSLIVSHPQYRNKLIKSLIQSLSILGCPASRRSLQQQSKIITEEQRIKIIRDHLKSFRYRQASEQLPLLSIPSYLKKQIDKNLQELQLDYWLCTGEQDLLLGEVMTNNISEGRRRELCEMIALGTSDIQLKDIEERHELIINKCEKQNIQSQNIHKIIHSYLDSPDNQTKTRSLRYPKSIVAESQMINRMVGKASFVKFNINQQKIALLSQSNQQYDLSIWSINNHFIKRDIYLKQPSIGCITELKWSKFGNHSQSIAVCSYTKFILFNEEDLTIAFVIENEIPSCKFLCFQWHPLNQIIYIGGIFQYIACYDCKGGFITNLNPYIQTRKIVFSPKGTLFTIAAATEGQILKYSIQQQKIVDKFQAKYIFMDLKYSQGRLIATNKQFIYIINAESMTTINAIVSPINQKLFTIQAFAVGAWIIIFNEKLKGVLQYENRVEQTKWHNCDAVDVGGYKMVTFNECLKVWGCKEDLQESSQQTQMQVSGEVEAENGEISNSSDSEQFSVASEEEANDIEQKELEEMEEQEEYEYQQMIEIEPEDIYLDF